LPGLSLDVWKSQGSVGGTYGATMTLGNTICQTQFSDVFVWYWWRHHQKKEVIK
jgi:hypothetical protein